MSAMTSVRGRAVGFERRISATGGRGGGATATLGMAFAGGAVAKNGAGCGPGWRKRLFTTLAPVATHAAAASRTSRGRDIKMRNGAGSRTARGELTAERRRTLISGALTSSPHVRSGPPTKPSLAGRYDEVVPKDRPRGA